MRILFVAAPLQGHLLPLVPLAAACRDAGHDVTLAAGGFPPDVLGLRTADIGAGFSLARAAIRVAVRRPMLARAEMAGRAGLGMVGELFGLANLRLIDALTALAERSRPDLIVYEPLAEAGAVVASRLSIPSVLQENTLWPALDLFAAVTGSSAMRGLRIDAPELTLSVTPPSVAARRDPTGQPAPLAGSGSASAEQPSGDGGGSAAAGRPTGAGGGSTRGRPTGAGGGSTGGRPTEAGGAAKAGRVLRPVPFSGGGAVPPWLLSPGDRPRVLVSRSTLDGPNDGDPGPAVIAAAGQVDADFVLVRPAARKGSLPPNVHAVGRIPLNEVLPHAAAFIHHAGAGSVLGGLAAGLPELATPGAGDRRHNAELLARRGAGLAVPARSITAADLERLLTDETLRSAAQAVAAEIAEMPAPAEVVPDLEKLVGA